MISELDVIFNSYKIKYNILDKLFTENKVSIDKKEYINLYIDFDSIIRNLTAINLSELVRAGSEDEFKDHVKNTIRNTCNLIAHYRRYFTTRKRYSRIIVFLSYPFVNIPLINNMYVDDYKKYYYNTINSNDRFILKRILEEAFQFIKIIIEYIEDVYFVMDNSIEHSLIPKIISSEKLNDTNTNIIVTRDKFMYQYINNNFIILRPKYKEGSYLVNRNNCIEIMKNEYGITTDLNVDSGYIVYILSILGDTIRSVPKIKGAGLSKALKVIHASNCNKNNILEISKVFGDKSSLIMNNYYAINIDYLYSNLTMPDKVRITNQLTDRFDNVGLSKLNDQLFTDSPINIEDLTDALRLKHCVEHPFNNNIFVKR